MAVSKAKDKKEEQKALDRYKDQPGQWIDTTPKAVKARQEKAWQRLHASLAKSAQAKAEKKSEKK